MEVETSLWAQFDEKVASVRTTITPDTSVVLMVRQYLEMPYVSRTEDPLAFWEKHEVTLPEQTGPEISWSSCHLGSIRKSFLKGRSANKCAEEPIISKKCG